MSPDSIAVVLDVNVLVSAQLVQGSLSAPFRAYDAVLGRAFLSYVSPSLTREYTEVMLRPHLMARHGLDESEVREVVAILEANSIVLIPARAKAVAPDSKDQYLWDLLAGYPEAILVTGDGLLLASDDFPGRILSPRDFAEQYLEPEAT